MDNLDDYSKELELKQSQLKTQQTELENKQIEWDRKVQSDIETIETLTKEKSQGFPWLAKAYGDYFSLHDSSLSSHLMYKAHPARKAAEELRQISKERREAERAARLANYLLDYSRYLAPWLDEYIGLEAAELDEIIKQIHSSWEKKEREFDEEVRRHYGPKYEGLTPTRSVGFLVETVSTLVPYYSHPDCPTFALA